jgi:hypothetical protein
MKNVFNKIDHFFKMNFKKKFVLFLSIPLLLSTVYCIDYFILPEIEKTDRITRVASLTMARNQGGAFGSTRREIGYRYTTEGNFEFTTYRVNIKTSKVKIKATPLLKNVKEVEANTKKISLQSGFSGLKAGMMLGYNAIALLSVLYILLTKRISENARLNLIFMHVFIFLVWLFVLWKLA